MDRMTANALSFLLTAMLFSLSVSIELGRHEKRRGDPSLRGPKQNQRQLTVRPTNSSNWATVLTSEQPSNSTSPILDAKECASDSQLSTGFDDTREKKKYQGVLFDVHVPPDSSNEDVRIFAFDFNLDSERMLDIQVFTRLGTHVGYENDRNKWDDRGVYLVDGQDEGRPSHLVLKDPVLVKPGEVLAFYIAQLYREEMKMKLHYRKKEGLGAVLAADGALEILVGTAKERRSDVFDDHNDAGLGFSGTIHYGLCGSSSPRPSAHPTRSPTSSSPTASPSAAPTYLEEEMVELITNFQLRMFWEDGMVWQSSRREKSWCAEARDKNKNIRYDHVKLKECDDGDKKQRWTYENERIRSRATGECLEHSTKTVRLKDCNGSTRQMWGSFRTRMRNKFQIRPKTKPTMCLTQQHHPRSGEELYIEPCKKAFENDEGIYDDTSHWVIGFWDGKEPIEI